MEASGREPQALSWIWFLNQKYKTLNRGVSFIFEKEAFTHLIATSLNGSSSGCS
jgi:hypothetical protein